MLEEFTSFLRDVLNLGAISPVPMSEWIDAEAGTNFQGLIDSILKKKGGDISMDSQAWIALINLIISSGLADKLVALLITLFNALEASVQTQIANAAAKVVLNIA